MEGLVFIFSGSNQNNRQNAIESRQSTKGKTTYSCLYTIPMAVFLLVHYIYRIYMYDYVIFRPQ